MIVTIDDREYECEAGEYLLDVAKRNGLNIPALCSHEGLPRQGCCRVCIVEAETGGHKKIVTACLYPVEQECKVYTGSDRVKKNRQIILALLRARAPESEAITRLCEEYGASDTDNFVSPDDTADCILCGLCVKACKELGTDSISTVNRGVDKKVSTPYDEPSLVCVGCASCASVCPTGSIKVYQDEENREIWNKKLPLAFCTRCGAVIGTAFEIRRAARRLSADPPKLCEKCRKLAMTDEMAHTFGI